MSSGVAFYLYSPWRRASNRSSIRQGRQYRVSLTCPGGPNTAVDVSSFQCDQELSRLLHARGVGKTLRARLAQASDVNGFMAELTDVLEKVRRFGCGARIRSPLGLSR